MEYNTYLPTAGLASFVKCYWTLEASPDINPEKQRIVPDGCMEMIFHQGDLYRQWHHDDNSIIQPRCFVFGQITAPLEIEPTGRTEIFAVRFLPDGFIPFASVAPENMENSAIPLSKIFGSIGMELENEMLAATTTTARVNIVENFLLKSLRSEGASDRIAKKSVDILLKSKGQTSVEDITGMLNVHRRQLERRFASMIGLSPKQLTRIIRFQSILKVIDQKQYSSLTSLAYENGYYDQAHFIKDFKEFTGVSPRQFYSGSLKMSSLFIGTD